MNKILAQKNTCGEVLEWRALLYMSNVLARLFGNSACNAIFFMLGVAEGCKIIESLLQENKPFDNDNGLDLHEVFKKVSKFLIENNYVEKIWFFESEVLGSNVKEYHVRVSNNPLLSILLEQGHKTGKKENSCFCIFLRGMLKSIFVKLLGNGIHVVESECQLENQQFCEYVIRKAEG